MRTYRIKYLLRYTPHREKTRYCWQITTVTAMNKREARRKISSNNNTIFVLSVKEVTHI